MDQLVSKSVKYNQYTYKYIYFGTVAFTWTHIQW